MYGKKEVVRLDIFQILLPFQPMRKVMDGSRVYVHITQSLHKSVRINWQPGKVWMSAGEKVEGFPVRVVCSVIDVDQKYYPTGPKNLSNLGYESGVVFDAFRRLVSACRYAQSFEEIYLPDEIS